VYGPLRYLPSIEVYSTVEVNDGKWVVFGDHETDGVNVSAGEGVARLLVRRPVLGVGLGGLLNRAAPANAVRRTP